MAWLKRGAPAAFGGAKDAACLACLVHVRSYQPLDEQVAYQARVLICKLPTVPEYQVRFHAGVPAWR